MYLRRRVVKEYLLINHHSSISLSLLNDVEFVNFSVLFTTVHLPVWKAAVKLRSEIMNGGQLNQPRMVPKQNCVAYLRYYNFSLWHSDLITL